MQLLVIQFTIKMFHTGFYARSHIIVVSKKHSKCKFYYQEPHLKYLCNLARYRLQLPEDDTIVSKHVGV